MFTKWSGSIRREQPMRQHINQSRNTKSLGQTSSNGIRDPPSPTFSSRGIHVRPVRHVHHVPGLPSWIRDGCRASLIQQVPKRAPCSGQKESVIRYTLGIYLTLLTRVLNLQIGQFWRWLKESLADWRWRPLHLVRCPFGHTRLHSVEELENRIEKFIPGR